MDNCNSCIHSKQVFCTKRENSFIPMKLKPKFLLTTNREYKLNQYLEENEEEGERYVSGGKVNQRKPPEYEQISNRIMKHLTGNAGWH